MAGTLTLRWILRLEVTLFLWQSTGKEPIRVSTWPSTVPKELISAESTLTRSPTSSRKVLRTTTSTMAGRPTPRDQSSTFPTSGRAICSWSPSRTPEADRPSSTSTFLGPSWIRWPWSQATTTRTTTARRSATKLMTTSRLPSTTGAGQSTWMQDRDSPGCCPPRRPTMRAMHAPGDWSDLDCLDYMPY